jgi:hypothetical protein
MADSVVKEAIAALLRKRDHLRKAGGDEAKINELSEQLRLAGHDESDDGKSKPKARSEAPKSTADDKSADSKASDSKSADVKSAEVSAANAKADDGKKAGDFTISEPAAKGEPASKDSSTAPKGRSAPEKSKT